MSAITAVMITINGITGDNLNWSTSQTYTVSSQDKSENVIMNVPKTTSTPVMVPSNA